MPEMLNTEKALTSTNNGVIPPFFNEDTFIRVNSMFDNGNTINNGQSEVKIRQILALIFQKIWLKY